MARKSTMPVGDLKLALRPPQTMNSLLNLAIHDWAQREILATEFKQLFKIANECGIDFRSLNESGIDLALEISRKFIPGFTPSMETRGNPRNAAEQHKEKLTYIRTEVAQGKTIPDAAKAYLKSKKRTVSAQSIDETVGQYHRARRRERDRTTTKVDEIDVLISKALARKKIASFNKKL